MKQPMSAAKKAAAKSIVLSTSARYKGTPKVSFSTIDEIKKMGMTAALKKAGTSSNKEYIEGVRRMYGEKRLAAARGNASTGSTSTMSRTSPRGAERNAPAKKSTTKTVYNPRTGQPVTYTEPAKKAVAPKKKATPSKATKSPYTRGSSNAPGGR